MSAIREAMSHAVLGWVKPELDETLRLARTEVETFVEEPDDTTRMNFCAGYLHQVQGTLRMVELYAPAMVAEELELLARALQENATSDRDEACATLMRGTVLLPDYLERLQNGHRDIPIVLLPLLNDIRAARGAPGLSESVLFAPDLEQPLPQALPLPEVLPWQARQARVGDALEQFDQALSAWPEEGTPVNAVFLAESTRRLLVSEQFFQPVDTLGAGRRHLHHQAGSPAVIRRLAVLLVTTQHQVRVIKVGAAQRLHPHLHIGDEQLATRPARQRQQSCAQSRKSTHAGRSPRPSPPPCRRGIRASPPTAARCPDIPARSCAVQSLASPLPSRSPMPNQRRLPCCSAPLFNHACANLTQKLPPSGMRSSLKS